MTVGQIDYNRSTRTQPIKYIVIHDTGNPTKTANAQSHFNYFNGGNRDSSADFFVDSDGVWQVNDYTKYYTWHCGDGKGKYGITNQNSIGVEMCINADGDYEKAFANTIDLAKELMAQLDIPLDRVVRHYDASRKNCPQTFRDNDWQRWSEFKTRLEIKTMIETTEQAIQKLVDKGVINSPEYWTSAVQIVNHLGELLIKFANII